MPARSAGHWLSILDDPTMATAWHSENDIHARGAAWARRRLSTLGDEHEAPALWIDSNDDQSLSRQLAAARTNLRWTMDTDRLGAMLPDLLRRLHEAGRGDAAEALLQGWRLRHGTAEAIDLDGSWTPPVDQNDAGDGNQSIPRRITGRHLSPSPSSIADMDHDLTLLLSTNTLQGIESSTFETRWTQPTDAIFGNLLQADDERLTILLADGNGDISLQEIDPKTGSTLGRLTDIAAMFETPPINTSRLQPIMPDGRMIGLEDILVVANDSMVAFVRRDGAAMVINGAIQDESVHQLRLPLRVVHDLEAWPDGFVVIGPAPESSQSIAVSNADPAIVHVEATTGDVLEIEWPDTLGRVLWIERSPLDDLILGGEQGIAMVPRPEQKATWMNTDTRLQYTRKGWATGESLLMLDAEDQLATLNLVDGSINGPLGTPRHRTLGTLKMIQPEPDGFQILREGALVLHDTQGTLTGTDSLPGTMQHEHLVRNGTEYLLVSYLQSISRGQTGARGGGRQHLYRVHRLDASGRLIDLFDLYPLQSRIRAVRSLGTGLVLETDSAVELIPLPDDSVQ